MHHNLEKRFVQLAVAGGIYDIKMQMFRERFHLLFDALAQDMGITRNDLGKRLGFDPIPKGGNAIMNGTAEPSTIDCDRLLGVYDRWLMAGRKIA
jgi:hypothetical protein